MGGWFGSGLGMFLGQYYEINQAVIVAFIIPLLLGTFYGGASPNLADMQPWQEYISRISFARYTTEAASVYENEQLPDYIQEQIGFPWLESVKYEKSPQLKCFLVL